MPAVSRNQRVAMAIAEHNPSQLYAKDASMLKMNHQQLHDFAATPQAGLPKSKSKVAAKLAMIKKDPDPIQY